jgi:hypothetical protein
MNYWINTVTSDLVKVAYQGGFTQAGRGKRPELKKLAKGDLIAFYSPRTESWGGDPLQAFTAVGQIIDEKPYQITIDQDTHRWRRQVDFFDFHVAPIRPIIDDLDFIKDKIHWGGPFHHGLFQIKKDDFERIAEEMGAELEVNS